MSENKFIRHLQGKDTAKSVLEIRNQNTPTSFANMPDGTSNANDVYSDRRGDAAGVLKGTENWKLNNSLLIETSTIYGDGRDFIDDFEIGGSGLWVNATCTFTTARRFTPNTKFVLKLCGHDLDTVAEQTVGFTLIVKFGSTVITKVFSVPVQAFDFCKEFEIDFGESNSSAIKVAANSTMQVQLLCADANAQATIYNGMTVFTALQRRVDSETVSSNTLSLDEIETDLTTHIANKNNPHEVTKAQVGLGNCDNTSDLDKPISTATQTALDGKVSTDGSSIMTGPLLMRATADFKCAIAPYWDGVGFFKLNNNNSVTLIASLEYQDSFAPAENNVYNIGSTSKKWKNLYLAGKAYMSVINNGYDIAVPVTMQPETLALKSEVDLAANSGRMITDQGVWYAKMYAASTVPTGAEYDGKNYADFSQVDSDNNPVIKIYTGASGAWTLTETITPPADYDGYVPITSKIWDIIDQTGQQGGRVMWNHQSKDFTPYPQIISFKNAALTGVPTAPLPTDASPNDQIATKEYVDSHSSTGGYHPDLLDWKWTDHELDNPSWLRADTFSWQPGSVYEAAYNQLVEDLASSYMWQGWKVSDDPSIPWVHTKSFLVSVGETVYSDHELTTAVGVISAVGTDNITVSGITYTKTSYGYNHFYETIDGITIGGYVASNGRKICTSSAMIERVEEIYNATGVAWYYVLDATNKQFKLPRSKHNKYTETLGVVGNGMTLGVTDGTNNAGVFTAADNPQPLTSATNDYGKNVGTTVTGGRLTTNKIVGITTDATKSGLIAQQTQDTDQYKHLYFYVGEFTQEAIENTAGINTEDFNDKADTDFGNTSMIDYVVDFQAPTAQNNYTWYRKYKSGWVEQGICAAASGGASVAVSLPVTMADTNYSVLLTQQNSDTSTNLFMLSFYNKTASGFTVNSRYAGSNVAREFVWQVCGRAA